MDRIIGVDFDNTVVSYDEVMYNVAIQWGLIPTDTKRSKRDIRASIRFLPDGELAWQRLQSVVYGSRMDEAKLIDGVKMFFRQCQERRVMVYIISHKTELPHFEPGINLRSIALNWMRENSFFEAKGLGLMQEAVYFEATRSEKIKRIKELGCTHFIDDLEETFLENSFPADVDKILYAPHIQCSRVGTIKVVHSWKEVNDYLFYTRS